MLRIATAREKEMALEVWGDGFAEDSFGDMDSFGHFFLARIIDDGPYFIVQTMTTGAVYGYTGPRAEVMAEWERLSREYAAWLGEDD